jgi:hypothetical protein
MEESLEDQLEAANQERAKIVKKYLSGRVQIINDWVNEMKL